MTTSTKTKTKTKKQSKTKTALAAKQLEKHEDRTQAAKQRREEIETELKEKKAERLEQLGQSQISGDPVDAATLKQFDEKIQALSKDLEALEAAASILEAEQPQLEAAAHLETLKGARFGLRRSIIVYLEGRKAWLEASLKAKEWSAQVDVDRERMRQARTTFESLGGYWGGLPDFYGTEEEQIEHIDEILNELKAGGELI